MTRRTFVRPEAQSDVTEAVRWYAKRDAGLGIRFLRELRTSLSVIARNPLRFPLVEQGTRRSLLKRFPYSVYFLVQNGNVIVIAVLHQHRQPQIWKDRK